MVNLTITHVKSKPSRIFIRRWPTSPHLTLSTPDGKVVIRELEDAIILTDIMNEVQDAVISGELKDKLYRMDELSFEHKGIKVDSRHKGLCITINGGMIVIGNGSIFPIERILCALEDFRRNWRG